MPLTGADGGFLAALDQAVGPLQRALEAVLAAAGVATTATELARDLGIEQTLAWRAWRLAHACTSTEAALFVIGPTAMEGLLSAATGRGAAGQLADAVRAAHRRYREFVRDCAGDEPTLRMMLGAADDARLMFNANRLRVGVQAASQLRCCVMYPSSMEGIASAAVVEAFGDLWWLRANAQAVLRIVRLFHTHAPDEPGAPVLHLATPLDPDLAKTQSEAGQPPALPRLERFCGGDSTAIEREQVGGTMIYSIRPRAVGRQCPSTLCFGEVLHDYILPLSADPQTIFSTSTLVPAELLILEVYVHRDLVDQGFTFRPLITDLMFRPVEFALWGPRIDLATLSGSFQAITPAEAVAAPIRTPQYHELVEFVFERVHAARPEFFCFRLRLPTPPPGLMVSLIAGEDPSPPGTT